MSKYKITVNGKEYEMDVELMDGSVLRLQKVPQ